MTLFTVDHEKCERDGICAAECPMGIIEVKDKESVPHPIEGAENLCINCGHCVAVCPHGAFSLTTMEADTCPAVDGNLLPSFAIVSHMIRARRSIRVYKDKRVGREVLEKLIDTARYAPTGKNTQLVRWLIITNKDTIKELAG